MLLPGYAAAMRLALAFVLVSSGTFAGGGPRLTPEQQRDRAEQDKREARFQATWKQQGARAVPALVAIACGNDPNARDVVQLAARTLAEHGAAAARALYRYAPQCSHRITTADVTTTVGVSREELIASIYCEMAGVSHEPEAADRSELVRWASDLADESKPQHGLAVKTLAELLARGGLGACDPKLFDPMLPTLLERLRQLPTRGFENVVGTHRHTAGPRDELVIQAVAQSGAPEGIELLRWLYAQADLRTRLTVIEALSRAGPRGARATPDVLHFLQLTKDDEARVLGLRALERFGAPLGAAELAVVAPLVGELMSRIKPREAFPGGTQDGWALLGVEAGMRVLNRSVVARGTPAQVVLLAALAAPIANHLREAAAAKLLADEATLSATQRACARDTLSGPPPTSTEVVANAFGPEISFKPPATCTQR
jgi:hypothetical protein